MFVATVINFILCSLNTGDQVARFIVSIRKALVLDIDHPLSEKQELVNDALWNLNVIGAWARYIPVSNNLSLPDFAPNNSR